MAQAGFFDVDERLAGLSAAGDPLERLERIPSGVNRRGIHKGASM